MDELIVIVRRTLDEWEDEEFKSRLEANSVQFTVVLVDSLDDISGMRNRLQGVDGFLCTLGTRVKVGKDQFIKVDYQYPMDFARLATQLEVKHYGLLTSQGADPKSMFLYMKTKGEVERDIKKLELKQLTIF